MDFIISNIFCEPVKQIDGLTKHPTLWTGDVGFVSDDQACTVYTGDHSKDAEHIYNAIENQCQNTSGEYRVEHGDSIYTAVESDSEDILDVLCGFVAAREKDTSDNTSSELFVEATFTKDGSEACDDILIDFLQGSDEHSEAQNNRNVTSGCLNISRCHSNPEANDLPNSATAQYHTVRYPHLPYSSLKCELQIGQECVTQSHQDNKQECKHSSEDTSEDSMPAQKQTYENSELSKNESGAVTGMGMVLGQPKKRKRRRQVNVSRDAFPVILPPCRVCNEKASGFHYGANTCEACKGFFRRTLAKKNVFFPCRCARGESGAWKTGPVRNGCPSCRYERCLLLGMSTNAIKIGRYTLVRRTENIKEVKTLETLETLYGDVTMDATMRESQRTQPSLEFQLSNLTPASFNHVTECDLQPPMKIQRVEIPAVSLTNAEQPKRGAEITQEEIVEIVHTLEEARKKHCNRSRCSMDKSERLAGIKRRQDECHEQYKLKTAIFGEMKPLSKREHLEIYKATGIDIDDRFEDIRGAVEFFEKRVRCLINFAKTIPGFKAINLEDQATLIKCSRVQSTLIGCYRRFLIHYNMDLQVAAVPWGKKAYHLNELARIYPRDFVMMKFNLAREIETLGLTPGEEMVMRAIAITLGDHCLLQEPKKVQELNNKLVRCLQHLLSKRLGDGDGHLLQNVFDMFTKLRHLKELDDKVSKELLLDWPLLSSDNLLVEFIT